MLQCPGVVASIFRLAGTGFLEDRYTWGGVQCGKGCDAVDKEVGWREVGWGRLRGDGFRMLQGIILFLYFCYYYIPSAQIITH